MKFIYLTLKNHPSAQAKDAESVIVAAEHIQVVYEAGGGGSNIVIAGQPHTLDVFERPETIVELVFKK